MRKKTMRATRIHHRLQHSTVKALVRKPSLDEQAHQCNYSKRTVLLLSGEMIIWRGRCVVVLVIKRFARLVSRSPENSTEGNAHPRMRTKPLMERKPFAETHRKLSTTAVGPWRPKQATALLPTEEHHGDPVNGAG